MLEGLVSHELTTYLSAFDLFLTLEKAISKVRKPDNFKSCKSLKFNFNNMRGLCTMFVKCETLLESNSPDILALCITNFDESIDSGNFSLRDYLPLHDPTVYVMEGFPFAQDLSLENAADFYLCFLLALLHSVSYFFFLF